MAAASYTVHISLGRPFGVGTCASCGFDSLYALLVLVNNDPRFRIYCARTVCRESNG